MAVILSVFMIACSSSSGEVGALSKSKDSLVNKTESRVTVVQTIPAGKKPFYAMIHSNGRIRSLQEQQFVAAAGNEVVLSNIVTGKRFSTGAMLMQMETIPAELRLERAKLAYFNSQKEYESLLLGYESLLKGRDSAQAETIKKKLRISTGMLTAEEDIKQAKYELSRASIKAPFNGIVADVKVRQGQIIRGGEELFTFYDPANLVVDIKVLESDIGLLKKGLAATVTPISIGDKTCSATVHVINPYVDDNGLVAVQLRINNNEGALFPGMNCTVTIKVPMGETLVIPKEAVVMRSGRTVVFTVEKDLAQWHYVVTGKDNGTEVEIKQGLAAGARVITTNNLQLAHEAQVQEMK